MPTTTNQPTTAPAYAEGELIATRPATAHPDDHFLKIVLRRFMGQYVTHIFNTQDGGHSLGHYHEQDLAAALADFNARN